MENSKKINPIVIFSIIYILGIISFNMEFVPILAIILLFAVIFCLYKNIFSEKPALVFYLAFVLAIVNCHFQIKNFDALSQYTANQGQITGIVETIPTTNISGRTKFYMKVDSFDFGKNKKSENASARTIVTLYGTPEKLSGIKIGDKIQLTGALKNPIRATNPSQFDYGTYLKNHKTFSTFYAQENALKFISPPATPTGKFLQKLSDKRNSILSIHSKYLKSPNLEVLGGIVFGDDAINPPQEIKTSFINSGLLHILAASGMNVSIIFGIWFFLGTRLRINYKIVITIGALLVLLYTLMTGMGPSVLRASLMIEFILFGKLLNKNADSIALVFLVALLLLLYNPLMINDIGFQLSFVVTFALIFYCPPLLEKTENKAFEFLAGSILIPFVAQLFAGPIQMFYFNSFATYSIIANFVITPFIMIISFLGFLGSIFAMIPIIADKICFVFDTILNPVITILVNISDYFSNLPHSLLTTSHPSYFQIVLFYGILIFLGFLIRNKFSRKKLAIISTILCIIFALSFVNFYNRNCEVIVFDVGNADSFLIKTPDKKYIMIDTAHGSTDNPKYNFSQAEAIMGKYLKDMGVKELELLVLTHFDSDHSGGAVDLMKILKVKNLLLSKETDESKTTQNIFKYIEKTHQNYSFAKNNKIIYNKNGIVLRSYSANFTKNRNDNDNSTIILLSYGDFDMLFMADAGTRTFEKIKNGLNNNKIEIIKTGHHGAKNTVNQSMLKTINADFAIISTGLNTYGHPHIKTIETLEKSGVSILRTDIDRALKISSDSKVYKIYTYDNKRKRFLRVFSKTVEK